LAILAIHLAWLYLLHFVANLLPTQKVEGIVDHPVEPLYDNETPFQVPHSTRLLRFLMKEYQQSNLSISLENLYVSLLE
jgi:hypothetical protein